jgi:hypothetical protein
MKPLKKLSLTVLGCLLLASAAQADIMVLKDGKRLEGQILSEGADSVRMKYRLTEKIWDEKDFPKADIAEIIRQTPSEVQMQEQKIREIIPTQDMMTADEYERLIQDRLRPFVNSHPGTLEAAEVEQMVKTLQAEKEKVVSGQLKVDGEWLSAADVKRDDYNIRAYRLRREITRKADSKRVEDWVDALRMYDRFIDPQAGFVASIHYPKLATEVIGILKTYETMLNRMMQEQPIIKKQQEDNLAKMIDPDLTRTRNAIQADLENWKNRYEAEKRNRHRWLVPYKYDLPSITEAQKTVVMERSKLQAMDLDSVAKQNEGLMAVFRYIVDENPAEAEAALEQVSSSAASGQEFSRVLSDLRGKITTLKNELQRKQGAQRTFNTAPAAGATADGPIVDDRVAQAMAAVDAPKEEQKTADEGDTPPAAEAGAAPAPGSGATAPAPAAGEPSAASAAAPLPPEESNFLIYAAIGGLALLLILLIAMSAQKKKKA